ncbi:MAG: UDP-N-acetylmuramate--L-alanine ligase [Flavobacteriales bacterium]
MKLDTVENVYFLGIGGIGMSAIARYFHAHGKHVMGYDRTATPLTTELQLEGIPVHFDDLVAEIPQLIKSSPLEKTLVVYTPAVPKDSVELHWFQSNGFTIKKRSEVLGMITENTRTIAIGGTHGKTTTSSLVAHLLKHSGKGCNAFLGGITSNYDTNLLLDRNAEWTVVEADEFDRSFLTLTPEISAITSTDADHLDIYGSAEYVRESFHLFANRLKANGTLYYKARLPLQTEQLRSDIQVVSYTIENTADFRSRDVQVSNGAYQFTFQSPEAKWENWTLGLPGRHNVENATLAAAIALQVGLSPEQIEAGLASFKGVKRRFETIIKRDDLVYIDDYAHHPTELSAAINSARELYPGLPVTGVFQPHLFTRTRDFADDFAKSLELLDEIILLPIYPARELPIEGIDSQMLLDKISKSSKKLVEKGELLSVLKSHPPKVLLTLGAGDIDTLVDPLKQAL